jgi:predicted secreted protein
MLQTFLQGFAVYFIVWWMTLFAVLPIGLRTQAEDNDIVLGTVPSAPTRFRPVFVFSMTTLVRRSSTRSGTFLRLTSDGASMRLPQIGPTFSNV